MLVAAVALAAAGGGAAVVALSRGAEPPPVVAASAPPAPPPVAPAPAPPPAPPPVPPPAAEPPPAMLTFTIDSEPPGADLRDAAGAHLGVTPLRVERAPADGEVRFVVSRRGHRDGAVTLRADRDGDARVTLPAVRRPAAKPAIDL
jgi:hypothetical protein